MENGTACLCVLTEMNAVDYVPTVECSSAAPCSSVDPFIYENIPGYEGTVAGDEGGLLPPPEPSTLCPDTPPSHQNWNIPSLSEEAARQAFVKYASDKRFFSSKAAQEAVFTSMEIFNTYRYRLETFTESRSTHWRLKPYYGESIDTSGQTPPGPWDIAVDIPLLFQDAKVECVVPHTASVKDCTKCGTLGRIRCTNCSGMGNVFCNRCCGTGFVAGYQNRYQCFSCKGHGRTMCWNCSGLGWTKCDICLGQLKVVAYIALVVKWTNNKQEYTVEQSSGLKMVKLDKVPGDVLYQVSDNKVHPVGNFPDAEITSTSQKIVSEHAAKFSKISHVLQQRQTIELLPIIKVTYEWCRKVDVFFVYGSDSKVSAVKYPVACCCNCTLM